MTDPFLSVVIPAYNEEARIGPALRQVLAFLDSRPYSWEVLVADDGSADATPRLAAEAAAGRPNLRILSLPHRGKGWAVKNAMLAAKGQYRLLCDADLPVPVEQMERLIPPCSGDVDVAVGSRQAPGATRTGEPWVRRAMGRAYNALVRLLALPGLADTQCGFKCFRGEIAPQLFQRQTLDGFAFDVEVLYLARRLGLTIREFPVDWSYRERSKVRALTDPLSMTWDLLRLRWRHRGV